MSRSTPSGTDDHVHEWAETSAYTPEGDIILQNFPPAYHQMKCQVIADTNVILTKPGERPDLDHFLSVMIERGSPMYLPPTAADEVISEKIRPPFFLTSVMSTKPRPFPEFNDDIYRSLKVRPYLKGSWSSFENDLRILYEAYIYSRYADLLTEAERSSSWIYLTCDQRQVKIVFRKANRELIENHLFGDVMRLLLTYVYVGADLDPLPEETVEQYRLRCKRSGKLHAVQ